MGKGHERSRVGRPLRVVRSTHRTGAASASTAGTRGIDRATADIGGGTRTPGACIGGGTRTPGADRGAGTRGFGRAHAGARYARCFGFSGTVAGTGAAAVAAATVHQGVSRREAGRNDALAR
jgi:hypothetical protein